MDVGRFLELLRQDTSLVLKQATSSGLHLFIGCEAKCAAAHWKIAVKPGEIAKSLPQGVVQGLTQMSRHTEQVISCSSCLMHASL